jgi:hypothetical protein
MGGIRRHSYGFYGALFVQKRLLTDRDYLKDTNNTGYQQPIKTLYYRIRRFHLQKCGQFGQCNGRIPHFSNSHDLSVKGPSISLPHLEKNIFSDR